jgi:hypothetical protein
MVKDLSRLVETSGAVKLLLPGIADYRINANRSLFRLEEFDQMPEGIGKNLTPARSLERLEGDLAAWWRFIGRNE